MQNIKRIGVRECIGTPKFALHQPCAIMKIGVVLKVITEARTDNLIGDVIMNIPSGFAPVLADRGSRPKGQSNDITINTNGDVRFGKAVIGKLQGDMGGLVVPISNSTRVALVKQTTKNRKDDTIVFCFGNDADIDKAQDKIGEFSTYSFSNAKEGFSAIGGLRKLEIKEINELLDPSSSPDGTEYKWTERVKDTEQEENKSRYLLVKGQEYITSLRFADPEVDAKLKTIKIKTTNMTYNTRSLQAYNTPKKEFGAKIPATKGT